MNAPVKKPVIRRFFGDTLASLISGLGGPKDKTRALFYWVNELDKSQLENLYRGDWIARKAITIPVRDALRQWRQWHASNDQITLLEEAEKKFQIKQKVYNAFIKARLYGGAALVLGVKNSGAPNTPLDLERVKKDSLEFVHVVSRWQLSNSEGLETDIMSPWFMQPRMWSRQVREGSPIDIHPSRVVRVLGEPLPDEETMSSDGWGDSTLLAIQDAIRQAGLVPQTMATTIEELKVDVIKIPGLTDQLSDETSTTMLNERLSFGMVSKSTVNSLVMDKEDDWQRIQLNVAGFPDIIKTYIMLAAGAADIPVTRFLGQSPAGLNSTGESDIRNYYDHVKSDQEDRYSTTLETLDEVLIRTATGGRDPDIYYEWNPLWQMTEVEEADIALKKANVIKLDVDMMLIPTDALKTARENQLIEDGTYPGLEQALAESDGEVVNPALEAQLQMQQMKGEQALAAQQAQPQPPDPNAPPPNTPPTTKDAGFDPHEPRDPRGQWTNAAMREYTPPEMDWEFQREYGVYARPSFPNAFASREDFQRKYDATPVTYLSPDEIGNLENSMAYAGLGKDDAWLERTFGHRRDVERIKKQFDEGVAPPIILERPDGSRFLMAGQTRLAASLAKRRRLGVKIIKVNDSAPAARFYKLDFMHQDSGDFIKIGPDQYKRKGGKGKIYNLAQVQAYYASGGWGDSTPLLATHDIKEAIAFTRANPHTHIIKVPPSAIPRRR